MKANFDQNLILAQMQRLNNLAKSGASNPAATIAAGNPAGKVDFGSLLSNSIGKVNAYQQQAAMAATQVETGDGGASLVKAVIASQKANVAFQATVQVRNKIVSAYQDIMNMPI